MSIGKVKEEKKIKSIPINIAWKSPAEVIKNTILSLLFILIFGGFFYLIAIVASYFSFSF